MDIISTQNEIDNIGGSFVLIFYQDGCVHCVKLKEAFLDAEKEIKSLDAKFYWVDVHNSEESMMGGYDIKSTPTFIGISGSNLKFSQIGIEIIKNDDGVNKEAFLTEIEKLIVMFSK